jgi:hypothetical protein
LTSTYRRPNCTIEIQKEAEDLLQYENVRIDQFANHLYLFVTNQPLSGNGKVSVHLSRCYSGESHLYISFEPFNLPKHLIPEKPCTQRLEEVLAEEPAGVMTEVKFTKLIHEKENTTP